MRGLWLAAALAAVALGLGGSRLVWAGDAHGDKKEPEKKRTGKVEIDPQVTYARTWDAAVEEAKVLNVPIVVHSHGFYCGPCWGLHGSILKNKKYIEFAEKSSVEVICLSSLSEGIEKKDERADTYETERDGKKVECMIEFPSLTREEMLALSSSKGGSYNNTGKVPYTCVVDPYTLAELEMWQGGSVSASTLMEAVTNYGKALQKEHGKGLARKDLRTVAECEAKATALTEKGDYASALSEIAKVSAKGKEWPESLVTRLAQAKEGVTAAAAAELERALAQQAASPAEAKQALSRLLGKAKGTGLEERIKQALAALAVPAGS